MKRFIWRMIFRLRYKITIAGRENIPSNRPFVILGDLSSQLDPLLTVVFLPKKVIPITLQSKICIEWLQDALRKWHTYFLPIWFNRKGKFYEKRLSRWIEALPSNENLLLFSLKSYETLVSRLCAQKEKRYVRIEGMSGSIFSSAFPQSEERFEVTPLGLWQLLAKNFFFFLPKRNITIRFSSQPFGTAPLPLQHVSYGLWRKKKSGKEERRETALVLKELQRLSSRSLLKEEMDLYEDLGLDSLDVTHLLLFLEQQFQKSVRFESLRTVADVINAALENAPPPERTLFQEKQLQAWENTKEKPAPFFPEGKTIPEVFLTQCDRMKSHMAAVDPNGAVSYLRIKTMALGLVPYFRNFVGTYIGILMPPLVDCTVLVLALQMAKKIPVLLNWTLGPRHLQEVVSQAALSIILMPEQILNYLGFEVPDSVAEKIVLLDEVKASLSAKDRAYGLKLARESSKKLLRNLDLREENAAVLLFTSGTEKKPKGVPLTHAQLLANHRSAIEVLPFSKTDTIMGLLPPFHVFGLSIIQLFPILAGLRVIYHPLLLDFPMTLTFLEKWKATVLCTAPTFLKPLLASANPGQMETLRLIIVGAEKTPLSMYELLRTHCPKVELLEGYGLTECSPILTLCIPSSNAGGVGRPLPRVEIAIVDPVTHQLLPTGERGLILARGPNIFSSYLNGDRPFLMIEGKEWFLTGDIGYLDETGALHLLSRLSRTVKIGAEIIPLPALEEALQAETPGLPIAITAIEGEEIHLVLYTTTPLELTAVNQVLRKAGFSNLLRIKEIQLIEQMPLTATGKIDYKKLMKKP